MSTNQPQSPSTKKPHKRDNAARVRTNYFTNIAQKMFLARRLKALLVDMFMIYTPILYGAYWILGSAQNFRDNQLVIFLCFVLYAGICALFITKTGQTPGLRYVCLRLVDISYTPESNNTQIGFCRAFMRICIWAFTYAIVVGFITPFVSKSHQCLHDSWLHTKLIDIDEQSSDHNA